MIRVYTTEKVKCWYLISQFTCKYFNKTCLSLLNPFLHSYNRIVDKFNTVIKVRIQVILSTTHHTEVNGRTTHLT